MRHLLFIIVQLGRTLLLYHNYTMLPMYSSHSQQCCQFGFFQLFVFLFWKNAKRTLAFFGELDFLCKFGRFKDDFGGFLGTGRFLDTVYGHRMIHFYWKLCTRFILFCFAVSWFYIFSFRLLFSKTKRLVKFINGVSLILFMHEICMYCLLKVRLGILKVSLCVYHVLGFFGFVWFDFLRVDLAFFAYDYLATLIHSRLSRSVESTTDKSCCSAFVGIKTLWNPTFYYLVKPDEAK